MSLSQTEQSVSDTFNEVLTTGTHGGTTSYSNAWVRIDTTTDADASAIVSTVSFTGTTMVISPGGSGGYGFQGWANRFASGRNKMITVDTIGATTGLPQVLLRWTSTSNIPAVVYFGGSQNYMTIMSSSGTFLTGPTIPGFATSNTYTLRVKAFENLVYFHLIDSANFPGVVINHGTGFDNGFQSATATANGLGANASVSNTYANFKAQAMDNLLHVIAVGDSNTEGDAGPVSCMALGLDYVQQLNYAFRDQNVVVTNRGISGYKTGDFAAGGVQDLANVLSSIYVPKAKNVVTVLLGTNDASAGVSLPTIVANLQYMIKTAHEKNCLIWICTYPPRNDAANIGAAPVRAILAINAAIRQLSNADRIVDLWEGFVDPTYYDPTNNLERALPSLVQSDLLHFTAAGHTVIAGTFSTYISSELNDNVNAECVNVNRTLFMTDSVSPLIAFTPSGLSGPCFTSATIPRSPGTKIVLWGGVGSANFDYALGIANNQLWFTSGAGTGSIFGFYTTSPTVPTLQIRDPANDVGTSTYPGTTSGTINTPGQIVLSGTNGHNSILFCGNGTAPPSFTRSVGTKIALWPSCNGASSSDFALGIDNSSGVGVMWYNVNASGDEHRFFNACVNTLSISGTTTTVQNSLAVVGFTSGPSNTNNNTVLYVFEDQTQTTPTTLVLAGNATYLQNNYIQLTPAVNSQTGYAYLKMDPGSAWTATFDYYYGGGTGADGLQFFVQQSLLPAFRFNNGGWAVCFDEFNNVIAGMSPAQTTSTSSGRTSDTLTTWLSPNTWATIGITYTQGTLRLFINGVHVPNLAFSKMPVGQASGTYLGFVGYNGGTNDVHRIRNIRVQKGCGQFDTTVPGVWKQPVGVLDTITLLKANGSMSTTGVGGQITVNGSSGTITVTVALAANTTSGQYFVANSYVKATSTLTLTVGPTSGNTGFPVVMVYSQSAGAYVFIVRNVSTVATSGTIKINYLVS